jgi:tetratricopeptide (TPR) repeat protein
MNEHDKAFARRMLKEKRLSIDQVELIKAEVDRGGRPFRDVAIGRGLLSGADFAPKPKEPMGYVYIFLLASSALIFGALLILTMHRAQERSKHDEELAIETSKSMTEAERKAVEARIGYQRSIVDNREGRAKEALAKARAAMARTPQDLNEAFVGYNTYLDVLPDDADVRLERAKVHELRRNYDLAITDLERAAALKPTQAPALKDRVAQLRLLLARTPK